MPESKHVPIIFLAFANRDDSKDYLRNLPDEIHSITDALNAAEKEGLCKVIEKTYVTTEIIFDVFQQHANRIALFHFGGHADSLNLLLQDSPANKEGLVPFLAGQKGLSLVFLNGCSTSQQTRELVAAGIPSVIGTNEDINDKIATDLAIRFYKGLAAGFTLEKAWQDAVNEIKAGKDESNARGFRRPNLTGKSDPSEFPWEIEYKNEVAEEIKNWSLPMVAQDFLFGLPPLPADIDYPKPPFRYLERYERKHARIFFGRSYYIRQLYDRITQPDMAPLILLYGQSGVGKSSLLESGLFPRLESGYHIVYKRRNRENGLAHTLQEAINSFPQPPEAQGTSKKKSVIILDQVEEVFTDPNPALPNELDDLMVILKKALKSPAPNGPFTIVLSYRKEFHAEIREKLKEKELDSDCSELFLSPINRAGIIEVVKGLTLNPTLKNRYNLLIEEDLPEIIADDLLEDRNTPVAPVLQFIMSKMWELTDSTRSDTRYFKIDHYRDLKKDRIAMKTFFDMQMEELGKWSPEVVQSGLVLDILKNHTTRMGTARYKAMAELRIEYANRQDILDELLTMLKKYYLLTDTDTADKQMGTSLAHDTLAQVVINEYNESNRPGQRAGRILAAKIGDFEKNKDNVWLDEADLDIVEQGQKGMKSLNDNEKEFLKISRKRKEQLERVSKRNKRIRVSLIILVIIVAIFSIFQWRMADIRTREANARRLAVIADSVVKDDPTIALRIAEKAWQLDKNQAVNDTIYKIYRENSFYKIIAGHKSSVTSMAISPDGKTILIGSLNTARLWDLQGKTLQEFKGHTGHVSSVAFSPDGSTILTGSWDKTARLWDLQGKTMQEFIGHTDHVSSVAFSPDSKTILTGSADSTARLWDLQGNMIKEFNGHQYPVTSVAFSPDGKTILTGSWYIARLWDMNGKLLQDFKGYKDSVTSVTFSPDGKTILTSSWDNIARLWDMNGKLLQDFKGHEDYITSVAFSPDGKTILTGSLDKTARLWNLQGKIVQEFKRHTDKIYSVAFSSDGKTILTGSYDNTARLWDLKGNTVQEFKGHNDSVTSVAFSPNGETILSGGKDDSACLWNLMQGKTMQEFIGHNNIVTSVAFSPDSKTIITGSRDNTARLWDLQGKMVQVIKGHTDSVTSVAFSPDGKTILTGSWDSTARLWDLQGNTVQVFKGHTISVSSVAFSPNGKNILTSSWDNTARLWDLEGNTLWEFKGHKDAVTSVAFSPDGKSILTGSDDKTARLWDLQGNTLWEFNGHTDSISSVAISPDGKTILTGSRDKTARLWQVAMPLEEFLEKGNIEKLTPEQMQQYGIKDSHTPPILGKR